MMNLIFLSAGLFLGGLLMANENAELVQLPAETVLVQKKDGTTFPQWNDPAQNVHIEVQMVYPKENSKKTAVIVIPGSGAGLPIERAQELAKQGFPALAVRYFDYQPNSPFNFSITQLPLEAFKESVKWLKSSSPIKIKKIVLFGRSRGGEAALLVGSKFPNLFDGIIAEVPSSHVWGDRANGIWSQYIALQPDPAAETASWTLNKNSLPFIPMQGWLQTFSTEETFQDLPLYTYRTAYENAFDKASRKQLRQARIKVEKINSPLLLTGGGQDKLWQSNAFAENVSRARKQTKEHKKDIYLIPAKAGHIWDDELEEPLFFPSGVYDFAKADFSNICAEEDLPAFLDSISPLLEPEPTGPSKKSGFPYKGHKDEIINICSQPDASLSYYLAPEYAKSGGTKRANTRWEKRGKRAINKFLNDI